MDKDSTQPLVQLKPHNFIPYTLIPNDFIDYAMAKANGEFVKVYLTLLRLLSVGHYDFSLSHIADRLLMTESDVLRALSYFQSESLLSLDFQDTLLREIHFLDVKKPVSEKKEEIPSKILSETRPEYSFEALQNFSIQEDFKQLFYMTQKYLGKALSENELKTLVSFHDWLGLPFEVIDLLIEYCVENDHRNMRYIEKVAIDWADQGITSPEKAKARTQTYKKSYFSILKAYGIQDRTPTSGQIKLMDKWLKDYALDLSVIVEACERTIHQINKPEMRYTDTILETWHKAGVKTVSDIASLDLKKPTPLPGKTIAPKSKPKNSKFSDYNQRQYDYEALEKKAMELRLKENNGRRYSS